MPTPEPDLPCELGDGAHLLWEGEQWEGGDLPRSVFSGVRLRPEHMVVTLFAWDGTGSSGPAGFGHSHVAFEWFREKPGLPRIDHRELAIYHLWPKRNFDGETIGNWELVWNGREGDPKRVDDPWAYYRDPEHPAKYRSWLVSRAAGEEAVRHAEGTLVNKPYFNLVADFWNWLRRLTGGRKDEAHNCATYALAVASRAGIEPAYLGDRLASIPALITATGRRVEAEGPMWERWKGSPG